MTTDELSAELKRRYQTASKREVALTIHLFGIEFADKLVGHRLAEIAEAGTGYKSYDVEIRKGMRLAKFVRVR